MCMKNASWTTIALTITMQAAARNGCFFHLSMGSCNFYKLDDQNLGNFVTKSNAEILKYVTHMIL